MEDATLTLLDKVLKSLRQGQTPVSFLWTSSAFNTVQPHLLLGRLRSLNVNHRLILWIREFLILSSHKSDFKEYLQDGLMDQLWLG